MSCCNGDIPRVSEEGEEAIGSECPFMHPGMPGVSASPHSGQVSGKAGWPPRRPRGEAVHFGQTEGLSSEGIISDPQ